MKYTKIIITTAVKTLVISLTILLLVVFLASLIFPKKIGEITYDLGMEKISLVYFNSAYNDSDNLEDAYFMVNLSNKYNKYDMVKKYYEKLVESENYSEFIDEKIESGLLNSSDIFSASVYVGIENVLFNIYVNSLIKTEKISNAIDVSFDKLIQVTDYKIDDIGVFGFFSVTENNFTNEVYDLITTKSSNIVNLLNEYFDKVEVAINNNIDSENSLTKVFLVSSYYRLIDVYTTISNIVKLDSEISIDLDAMQNSINTIYEGIFGV